MIVLEIISEDIIIIISPRILRLGGRAIFSLVEIIHIIEVIGATTSVPFINRIFRVFIFSYMRFLNIKRQEDVSPWVNIIISLPYCPNFEFESSPIIISPMCPTDE